MIRGEGAYVAAKSLGGSHTCGWKTGAAQVLLRMDTREEEAQLEYPKPCCDALGSEGPCP